MKWKIKFGKTKVFQKDLKNLKKHKEVQEKLKYIFEELEENPKSKKLNLKKLQPKKDQKYRIRIGDWRIIFSIDFGNNIILVHRIAPRSLIYK